MKEKEIIFRYDTLCITGDRYEFKKVKKRPLVVKFYSFFNVKTGIGILFIALMTVLPCYFIEHKFSVYQPFVFVWPAIIIFNMVSYEKCKDMILRRGDIISMRVKDNRLLILYRNESGDPYRYAKEVELQLGRYSLEKLGEALGYTL